MVNVYDNQFSFHSLNLGEVLYNSNPGKDYSYLANGVGLNERSRVLKKPHCYLSATFSLQSFVAQYFPRRRR